MLSGHRHQLQVQQGLQHRRRRAFAAFPGARGSRRTPGRGTLSCRLVALADFGKPAPMSALEGRADLGWEGRQCLLLAQSRRAGRWL